MSGADDRRRALVEAHLSLPGEVVVAADALFDPVGPDEDLLVSLGARLADLAADARAVGQAEAGALAEGLAALVAGLGRGTLDPMGPAGGVLRSAALALEDALLLLEAEEEPDRSALGSQAEVVGRAVGIPPVGSAAEAPVPTAPEPRGAAAPEQPGLDEVERWGPWEPPYPDMEDDFLEEVQGDIDNLQSGLIKLGGGATDPALINDLFRSSHSIKGQSGQMGAEPLGRLAHKLEDVLDLVRKGELELSASRTTVLLEVIDALQEVLGQLRATRHVEYPLGRPVRVLERIARGEEAGPTEGAVTAPRPEPAVSLPAPAAPPSPATPPARAPARRPEAAAKPRRPEKERARAEYLRVDFAKVDQVMNLVGDLFTNKIKLHDGISALDELHHQVRRLQPFLAERREAGTDSIQLDEEESRRLLADVSALAADIEGLTDRLVAAAGETDMISADLRDQVMVMRMVPLDSLFGRLERVVFDAVQKESRGREAGWKRARLEVRGAGAELDKVIANTLEVPLVHIVRNAVAHGIEPAAEREATGKPAEGKVLISAGQRGSQFVIRVDDDGRGMDPDAIRAAALRIGLVDEGELEGMSDKEIFGLIFRPGFTTAEKADDLKGRGVGLDEVMSKITQVKGAIAVDARQGEGTTVTLSVPLTLAINTVLIGQVAGESLALPMGAVERVVTVSEHEVERMGEVEVFTLLGKTVPLMRVDEVLAMGRPPAERPDPCYVVILKVSDKRFGLAFDRMGGKQDVVVKSLGTLLVEAPFVAGATLHGERCMLILDPLDVAAHVGKARGARERRTAARAERLRPRLLLVDDDFTARSKLRRIFEDAGLEVHEAKDGEEALAAAAATSFQMVSTDVIMPRMDGYELTRRLRRMEAYREVPILMISSKGEEVDKRAGFDSGVDYYLVKPVDRGELLALVEEVRL